MVTLTATSPARRQGARHPPNHLPRLMATLLYNGNRRDVIINLATLLLVLASLVVATAAGTLHLSALFWLPVGLLIFAIQAITALITQQEGFSLTWCTLVGLMIYEEARWSAFSGKGQEAAVLSVVAGAAACFSMVYYAIEETVCDKPSDLSGLRGCKWCLYTTWDRIGTTLVHMLCLGLGALLGAAADAESSRTAGFWVVLAIAMTCFVLLPVLLCHERRLRGACSLASVQPEPPAIELSGEELAVANLQQQLMRTRDEIAWLKSKQGSRAFLDTATSEARIADESGAVAAPEGATSEHLDAQLSKLAKRESTLMLKLEQRDSDITA